MKKELTAEELEAHQEEVRLRRVARSLVTAVKNNCIEHGLRETRLQLDFIINNQNTILPTELGHAQTVECFKAGIDSYKKYLRGE